MVIQKGEQLWKKRQRHGRLGYGLEEQKKRLIKKALLISENSLDKDIDILDAKEKVDKAFQVALKEVAREIKVKGNIKYKPLLGGDSLNDAKKD